MVLLYRDSVAKQHHLLQTTTMSLQITLPEALTVLEKQVAELERQESHHAEREAFHREERARVAAEHAQVVQQLEAFRAALATVNAELAKSRTADPADYGSASKPRISKMVAKVLSTRQAGQPFGVGEVTEAVNLRFEDQLRRPASKRHVSIALQRAAGAGKLRLVRAGRPHREALYSLVG